MASINDLINKISDFKCVINNDEFTFPGILQEKSGNIIMNAKFPMKQFRKIRMNNEIVILGNVSGKKITLIGCRIISASCPFGDNDNIFIYATPSEIIIGGSFPSIPMVKRIVISTSDLNYMFSEESPLEPNIAISKENPSVLNYTFPKPIIAKDKYGEIQIFQSFGSHCTVDFCNHNIISIIEYSFTTSLSIMDAVSKVSAAKSLFSFFGNGYISFGDITFEIDNDENVYGLWLNYKEDVPVVNEPFLIQTSAFESEFQKIWDAWLIIYESANPIPTLFYEIVCNRSTRINGFLNLSQAIEVYSNVFRYDDAMKLAIKNGHPKKRKEIPLKYIYQDILTEYNCALELIESNIVDYAQGLADIRNYYTHYNLDRYVEPTYAELFSASRILRFVLLAIVYTKVGINLDYILECKKRNIFSGFDNDVEIIFEYSKKKK